MPKYKNKKLASLLWPFILFNINVKIKTGNSEHNPKVKNVIPLKFLLSPEINSSVRHKKKSITPIKVIIIKEHLL